MSRLRERLRGDATLVLLVWAVGVLPLYTQPMRYEPYESQRAGFIVLLALLALAVGRRRSLHPLTLMLVVWGGWLLISSALAVNVSTALAGETVRRMGALTQAALLGGALIGAWVIQRFGGQAPARVFWLAGVVVSAVALLQYAQLLPTVSPTTFPLRASSTLGYPTYLGGWVAICVAVCVVYPPVNMSRRTSMVWWLGVLFIGSALLPSGARGSTLALALGLGTLGLAGAAPRSWPWKKIALIGVVALIASLPLLVVVGERVPLLLRLDILLPGNRTDQFREVIWDDALDASRHFPALTNAALTSDPLAALRPLIGYGAETQEAVFRLFPPLDQYTVDRAHTLWLDTLLTEGWLGLAARIAVLSVIGAWALLRLGLLRPLVLLPMALGLIVAAILMGQSAWVSVTITGGALAGLWIGLALSLWRSRGKPPLPLDKPALLALAALVIYLVDNQFSFETVAATFPFWIAVGGLFARSAESVSGKLPESDTPDVPFGALVGTAALGGAVLARFIAFSALNWTDALVSMTATCVVLLGGTLYLLKMSRSAVSRSIGIAVLAVAAGQAYGLLGASIQSPQMAALWDIVLVVAGSIGIWVGSARSGLRSDEVPLEKKRSRVALWLVAVCLVGALALWWADITGDIFLARSTLGPADVSLQDLLAAAQLRFWDARLQSLAGESALQASINATGDSRAALLTTANRLEYNAIQLKPYDTLVTLRLARLEAALAQAAVDSQSHSDRAELLFQASAAQDPYSADVYADWADFMWHQRGDLERARALIAQGLRLQPDNSPLLALRGQIDQGK